MAKTKVPLPFTAVQPDPGAKPSADSSTNGKSGLSMPDWVKADQANKESQPQPVSDGGKGVSN